MQERYSNNIYEEMSIEDIKREYRKTKADKESYLDDVSSGVIADTEEVRYVI